VAQNSIEMPQKMVECIKRMHNEMQFCVKLRGSFNLYLANIPIDDIIGSISKEIHTAKLWGSKLYLQCCLLTILQAVNSPSTIYNRSRTKCKKCDLTL
jgi:hypothetical protein